VLKYFILLSIKWLIRNQNSNRWSSPIPVLIFIAYFINGKFGIKTEEAKDIVVKEKPVKII